MRASRGGATRNLEVDGSGLGRGCIHKPPENASQLVRLESGNHPDLLHAASEPDEMFLKLEQSAVVVRDDLVHAVSEEKPSVEWRDLHIREWHVATIPVGQSHC